jgi:hypothetical protein
MEDLLSDIALCRSLLAHNMVISTNRLSARYGS